MVKGKHRHSTLLIGRRLKNCKNWTQSIIIIIIIIIITIIIISSLSYIYRVLTNTYLKETMSLGYTVLQLFLYLQSVLHVVLFRPWNMLCTFTSALSAVCVQWPIWLLLLLLLSLSPSFLLCRVFILLIFLRQNTTYIPETSYIPREYSVTAILLLLFMVLISLVSVLNLLYFYISTFRSVCAVPNMAVFRSSLTSRFPGMLLTYF